MAQIPADPTALSPQDCAAQLAQLELGEIKLLQELSAGPVSRAWLLSTSSGRMVLRADTPLAALLQLDRQGEAQILQTCFAAGLGPEWIWSDAEQGLMLTRWLPVN